MLPKKKRLKELQRSCRVGFFFLSALVPDFFIARGTGCSLDEENDGQHYPILVAKKEEDLISSEIEKKREFYLRSRTRECT